MLLDPHPSPSLPCPLSPHLSPSPSPPPPSQPRQSNLLDDIFSSSRSHSPQTSLPASPSHSTPSYSTPHNHQNSTHPSDIPRLRTTHTTAGYREGLSTAKSTALQPGFDEGYTLGAVLGLRVGELLGLLGGLCTCLGAELRKKKAEGESKSEERMGGREEASDGSEEGVELSTGAGMEAERSSAEDERQHEAMQNIFSLRQTATSDLSFEKIFAPELWDEDGIWKWEVPSTPVVTEEAAEADHEITFPAVVAAHPAIKKWTKIVEDVMREWGVEKGVFEGEEWEAGRVGG